MPRSNGHAEAAVKQMKKLIQANLGPNGILNRSSAMAGLQVFRNTPREPTGLSPAVMIFGHSIRDSVPMKREALLPEFRFKQEQRNLQCKQGKQGTNKELPLLKPKTPIRIQNLSTKKWDQTGFIVNFGQNTRKYMVRVGHKIIRRNRHFLKPIDVEAHSPVKQPAQAPPVRPATPQSSAFPVKDDWFTESGEQKQVNEEDNVSAKRKIRFDEPNTYKENKRPTTTSNLNPDSTPVCNPGTEQAKRSSPMQKQRLERPQLTWPNSIPLTPRKIKKVTETSQ